MADKPAPPAAAGNQPTVEDVNAIGNAAAGAATTASAAGQTSDQAGQAAAEAARAEANARGIELPQAVIDQIAKASAAATVAELSSQGALMAPAPANESASEPEEPAGEQPAAPEADPPPERRTFADKLLSGYRR